MILRAFLVLALLSATRAAAQDAPPPDPISALILRMQETAAEGDRDGFLALTVSPDAPGVGTFAWLVDRAPTRVVIKERDRFPLGAGRERLTIEVLTESGDEAAITTWRMDVADVPGWPSGRQITELERSSVITGLHRLSLDPQPFSVRNLTMHAVDLTLEIPSGRAFLAEVAEGPTGIVLLGRGRMRFAPSDEAERTQTRIFSDSRDGVIETDFDAVFVRFHPSDFTSLFGAALVETAADAGRLRRASEVFDEYVAQTYHVDLSDLSRDRWSLVPSAGDLVVEMRTRRMGSLTYTRSSKDAEDISLFDRKRRRNISVYASPEKLASRGRFYSEDDLLDYDVLRYDMDVSFNPDRLWLDATTRVALRTRAQALTSLTLRLADSLAVRGVYSPELGRLLHLRVVGQNSVIVNLPRALPRDAELVLLVSYGGRLEPQQIEGDAIAVDPQDIIREIYVPIEPQYLYSNRSHWYPQAPVTDYATARLRVTVPSDYEVVATGTAGPPTAPEQEPGGRARRTFTFDADRPTRYLAMAVSRFVEVEARDVPLALRPDDLTRSGEPSRGPAEGDASAEGGAEPPSADVTLTVQSNPRQVGRARPMTDRVAGILGFYAGIVGDVPYPSFTLAVAENTLPGGHSPAYFAVLNEPSPLTPFIWRNDPVAFDSYPPFFLAHEVAHQWWGHGVGWKNYHEQWLSEGFAQYFAVMYAGFDRGADEQAGMLRQMRRWAMEQSSQGPVYLGYRLGHLRGDGRVFRALVYNKGAMVLHMLRRLVGEGAFFAGLREFYREWKFRKAGTDDLRAVMERVSGLELGPFFEGWIYGSTIPTLLVTWSVAGDQARLRFEHRGDVIPTPVTVSFKYRDGRSEDLIVAVADRVVERTVPLSGRLRSVDVNPDHGALAEFPRN